MQFRTALSPQLPWLYSYEQYSVHCLRISCSSVTHLQDLPWIVEDLPCFTEVRSFSSWYALLLLFCCFFFSGKFQSLCTEYLSSPLLLSSLTSESKCLLPCIVLLLLLHTISSPLIKEAQNISGNPWHFPVTFILKYLTGCISHCCIVHSGNHGIDVHVPISQTNKWCEFPTYCCLETACRI